MQKRSVSLLSPVEEGGVSYWAWGLKQKKVEKRGIKKVKWVDSGGAGRVRGDSRETLSPSFTDSFVPRGSSPRASMPREPGGRLL